MKRIIQILKEEILTLPILIIILLFLKRFLSFNFPESAQYDLPSEVESLVFTFLKLVIFTSLSWLAIRIVFPPIFKYLRDEFYLKFENIESYEKRRISVLIFLSFLLALIMMSCTVSASEASLRFDLTKSVESQLNVRESTGHNDGLMVEKYLKSVGLTKGNPWCAAYCSYNLELFRVPNPQSGWSPNFALQKDIIWSQSLVKQNKVKQAPQAGDCFTIYFPNLKRVGHVGFIIAESGDYFITNEGNTNGSGGREGDGVYSKKREKSKIYAITNYITPKFKANAPTTTYNKSVFVFMQNKQGKYKDSNRHINYRTNSNHTRHYCANKSRHSICKYMAFEGHSNLSQKRESHLVWNVFRWSIKNDLPLRFTGNKDAIFRNTTKSVSIQKSISKKQFYNNSKSKMDKMALFGNFLCLPFFNFLSHK